MPTLLHPDDPAFHRMVAAFEGEPEVWLGVSRALRDAMASYAAQRSPYYREVVRPGTPFEEIPILTKAVVRERNQSLLAEGVHRDRWAPWRTSGSTGEPMSFVRDTSQGTLENLSAQRFLRWMHGVPLQATTVWVAARPVGEPSDRRRLLGPRPDPRIHPVPIAELTPDRLKREIRKWSRFRSWFLYGHASAIAWIADEVEDRGLEPLGLHCVVTTSDMLTEHSAGRIGSVFGVPVHSWYGSNEMNGFVAGTLPGTRRYAFNPLLVYLEVLDEAGAPVATGGTGRVILTDLNNLVMPFVRYDTNDLAVASSDQAGGFRLVDGLLGRDSEVLRFPSGRVMNSVNLGNALFVANDFVGQVRRFQCAQTGENQLDLRVVWTRPPTPEVERAIADALRTAADPDTAVRVQTVERLGLLPSGKAWVVRDETRVAPADEPARGPT